MNTKTKHKTKIEAEKKLKQYLNENHHDLKYNEKTTKWQEKDK